MQWHKQFSDSRNSWWIIVGVLRKCGCSVKELQLTGFNTHLQEDESSSIRFKWSPGITLQLRLNTPYRSEIASALPLLPEELCPSACFRHHSCERSWTIQPAWSSGPPPILGLVPCLADIRSIEQFLKPIFKIKVSCLYSPCFVSLHGCNFRTFTSHQSAKLKANYERPLRTTKVSYVCTLAYCHLRKPDWF